MKIITWNINSIRLRSPLIYKLLEQETPDILCLQECKSISENIPFNVFKPLGYSHYASWGQKSYNGVAVISNVPFFNIEKIDFLNCNESRHISVEINGITIHNFYFPAGGDIPNVNLNKKFDFKLKYIKDVEKYFKLQKPNKSILVGDLNIAPEEDDVWDHKKLSNLVSHSKIEINYLIGMKESGNWVDIFRKHNPSGKYFSWWSYRSKNWQLSNKGRRLDHIWFSKNLKSSNSYILKEVRGWDKPSDHAPVVAELIK